MHSIISDNQSAFLKGRNILDGVVVINEVSDHARRRHQKGILFKVNFEKAYDSVSWKFLDHMLGRLGFNEKWRQWISECLCSSSVSVLVNGSQSDEFRVSSGLKQGDPMALFLFLIVAEALSGIINNAVAKGIFKGYKITEGEESIVVSHIQYVDDTVVVGEPFFS